MCARECECVCVERLGERWGGGGREEMMGVGERKIAHIAPPETQWKWTIKDNSSLFHL